MTTSNKLTKKELNQVFWRSFGMEWDWNYERQMNMAYCYCMLPVIKKLYSNKEDQIAAMQRHLEFFNTTPQLSTLILGISAAMEESNANDPDFDTESINSVKVSLMGPLAGRYWCWSIISEPRKYLRTYLILIDLQYSCSRITLLLNECWL